MTSLFREHLSSGGHQRNKINVSTPEAKFKRMHRVSDKCCGEDSQRKQLFLNLKKESRVALSILIMRYTILQKKRITSNNNFASKSSHELF